jgi:hypothetical protein
MGLRKRQLKVCPRFDVDPGEVEVTVALEV